MKSPKKAPSISIGKRYFTVDEAIFHRRVHVMLNYSDADYFAWERKMGAKSGVPQNLDEFVAFSCSMEARGKPTEWIVLLKHFDWTIADQGSLIHEIVHTVVKIWASNNIPVTPDNQEFLAHSIGRLYEDIAGKVWRKKRRRQT